MKAEITQRIIDNDFVKENLLKMLPGTILLDENFSIIVASKDVCNLAMNNEKKLFGQSFFDIMLQDGLRDNILQQLNTVGYFQGQPAKIIHQFGNHTEVEISGFYLGLLSDFSTQILITVKDLSQISMYRERLQMKAAEFNELLYRSYHDLRGPLATINGLVNLNAHVKQEEERNGIIDMVGANGQST
jgi:nitrogen-specific signal transduction histidine kinase